MGCWFCSIESKKSIKSGAGPFGSGLGATACVGLESGKSLFDPPLFTGFFVKLFDDSAVPLLVFFLPFFASCCARYCRRLISKSGSFRYSSRDEVRLVGACLSFGISRRVAFSYCLAVLRNSTTEFVCFVNVL